MNKQSDQIIEYMFHKSLWSRRYFSFYISFIYLRIAKIQAHFNRDIKDINLLLNEYAIFDESNGHEKRLLLTIYLFQQSLFPKLLPKISYRYIYMSLFYTKLFSVCDRILFDSYIPKAQKELLIHSIEVALLNLSENIYVYDTNLEEFRLSYIFERLVIFKKKLTKGYAYIDKEANSLIENEVKNAIKKIWNIINIYCILLNILFMKLYLLIHILRFPHVESITNSFFIMLY